MRFDDAAADFFVACQAFYNVKAAAAADIGDDTAAARWGTAPWHLAVLSGLGLAFDILVGQRDGALPVTGQSVPVPPLYVERARALLEVLRGMQTAWQSTADADGLEPMKLKPPSKRFASEIDPCWRMPAGLAEFPATQPGAPKPVFVAEVPRAPKRLRSTAAGAGASEDDVGASAGEPRADAAPGASLTSLFSSQDASVAASVDAAKDPAEGISMEAGYGPNGESAQVSWEFGELWLSDREIMRKTVLRGKAVVYATEMVNTIRRSKETKEPAGVKKPRCRVAFPKVVWEEVMVAGFHRYPVGKLLARGTRGARVQFTAPPTSSRAEIVAYHNNLVDLCRVGARRFGDLLATSAAKDAAAAPAPAALAPALGAADDLAALAGDGAESAPAPAVPAPAASAADDLAAAAGGGAAPSAPAPAAPAPAASAADDLAAAAGGGAAPSAGGRAASAGAAPSAGGRAASAEA